MRYYTMQQTGRTADIMIYGDITSWRRQESDVSSYSFSKELSALGELDEIVVHINSYGGEVSEGFAVYNALRNHPASVTTVCDGFACSAASVIFMAGDRRVMNKLSALWIHNVQSVACGDSNALRKAAEESEALTELSRRAYRDAGVLISDEELGAMMNAETWIKPDAALSMGFATEINESGTEDVPEQSGKASLFKLIDAALAKKDDDPNEDDPDENDPDEDDPDEDDPDKDDPGEDDPDEDNPNEDKPEKDENAVQRWSGFFHALMNMQED